MAFIDNHNHPGSLLRRVVRLAVPKSLPAKIESTTYAPNRTASRSPARTIKKAEVAIISPKR